MFTIAMSLVSGWTLVHDYKRPDLNDWYAGLHRKGLSFGCCSKEDCHPTEAELRDGVWWARIGIVPGNVEKEGAALLALSL
jgi:hypothetical protein